jgi:hypothetical protein
MSMRGVKILGRDIPLWLAATSLIRIKPLSLIVP